MTKVIPAGVAKVYTIEETYVRQNEIDQTIVSVEGYLRSESGTLYLIPDPWPKKKLVLPDFPFEIESGSRSRHLIITGRYQVSGEMMIDNALSPIADIKVDD